MASIADLACWVWQEERELALVSVAALGCCWRALRADQTAN